MGAVQTRTTERVLVQYSTQLGADNVWTTLRTVTPTTWSEGAGPIIGYAELEQYFGTRYGPEPTAVKTVGVAPLSDPNALGDLSGYLVRICVENPAGTITDDLVRLNSDGRLFTERVKYTPAWYGVVHGSRFQFNGPSDPKGGRAVWRCGGLAEVLDQVDVVYQPGWAIGSTFRPAVFNPDGRGNRTIFTIPVGGQSVYRIDEAGDASAPKWTALQILQLILAAYACDPNSYLATTYGVGFSITLSGQTDCLGYIPNDFDPADRSVLDIINSLINPRLGCTWWLEVSGATAQLIIASTSAGNISLNSYTHPSSTYGADGDTLFDDPWIADLIVDTDASGRCGQVVGVGESIWVGDTFAYPSTGSNKRLAIGWTAAQQSTWQPWADVPGTESVYRRFLVMYDSEDYHPVDELTSTLPLSDRANKAGSTVVDLKEGRLRPQVYIVKAGVWEDITPQCRVSIENNPAAVVIDTGDSGTFIQGRLTTGYTLYVSLGYRSRDRSQVTVVDPDYRYPRAAFTRKAIATRARSYFANDTLVKAVESNSAQTWGSQTDLLSDTATLTRVALLRAGGLFKNAVQCSWADRGRIAYSATYRPGRLLVGVAQGAVIIRRTIIRSGDHWDTLYAAETVPDIDGTIL